VRHCAEWAHPMICTNGSLWTTRHMRDLAAMAERVIVPDSHEVTKPDEKTADCRSVPRKPSTRTRSFAGHGHSKTLSVRRASDCTIRELHDFLKTLGLFTSCTFSFLDVAGFE